MDEVAGCERIARARAHAHAAARQQRLEHRLPRGDAQVARRDHGDGVQGREGIGGQMAKSALPQPFWTWRHPSPRPQIAQPLEARAVQPGRFGDAGQQRGAQRIARLPGARSKFTKDLKGAQGQLRRQDGAQHRQWRWPGQGQRGDPRAALHGPLASQRGSGYIPRPLAFGAPERRKAQSPGGVAEWLKAAVLKTAEVKASGGSNPSSSARAV